MKFTPSPAKLIRFVNKDGKVAEVRMNRKDRRHFGIKVR